MSDTTGSKPSAIVEDKSALLRRLAKLDPISYGQERKTAASLLGITVTILDNEIRRSRRLPTETHGADLILSEDGSIIPVFANAAAMIRAHRKEWPLKFDEFSQRAFLGENPLTDGDLQRIAEWVQRKGVLAGRKITDDAAIYVANTYRFHEVKDWLESLEWDKIPRVEMILIDHAGAADKPLTRAFMLKWMIQAVARIYEPGCQADATLQLEGTQGLGKSSLLRALFGDRWFTDHLPNLDSKDALIQLLGIWCIEVAELAALGRSENSKVKQFLTSRDDRFRMPWDRLAAQHPRQSVFATTVNPGAAGTLKDETGGRRFWPVKVKDIDVAQILDRRPQLWAEAVHRYKDGETWYLNNSVASSAAQKVQDDRYTTDIWHEIIDEYLTHQISERKPRTKVELILTECLSLNAKSDWGPQEQARILRVLAHMKWERKQRRVDGKRGWWYVPPTDLADDDAEHGDQEMETVTMSPDDNL